MAREKVDNKLNVVIGTKAQVLDDTTIPDNSIIIVTDEEPNENKTWELLGARTSVGSISFSTSGLTELRVICYPNLPEEPDDDIEYLGDEKIFTINKLFKYTSGGGLPTKDATSGVALTIFNGSTAITVNFRAKRLVNSSVEGLPAGNLFTFEVYGR